MWIFERFHVKAWHFGERWRRCDRLDPALVDRTCNDFLAFGGKSIVVCVRVAFQNTMSLKSSPRTRLSEMQIDVLSR